jgi:cytochrome c
MLPGTFRAMAIASAIVGRGKACTSSPAGPCPCTDARCSDVVDAVHRRQGVPRNFPCPGFCGVLRPMRVVSPYFKTGIMMNRPSVSFIFKVATALLALLAGTAHAAGDPVRGAQAFRWCMACHSVNPGEHSTGPSLASLWHRRAGTAGGFPGYSSALKDANVEWNENSLDKWLTSPRQFIPGTSMVFQGIRDAQERADVIAYLKSVSENTAPAIPQHGGSVEARRQRGG